MRLFLKCTLALAFSLGLAAAADIDGTWLIKRQTQKAEVEFELKLKEEAGKLSGTYGRKERRRSVEIQDGTVDGNTIQFSTIQRTKKGENKLLWKATVSGDEIKGDYGREGARRRPFTAKKQ